MGKHYSLMDDTYSAICYYGIFLQLQFKNYTEECTSETGFQMKLNVTIKIIPLPGHLYLLGTCQ